MSNIENCSLTDNMENKAIRDHHRALFAEMVKKTGSHQSVLDRMLQELTEVTKQRDELAANMRDAFPVAHRLALEMECLLLSCTDTAATAKWWESAHEALEQWREFCREDAELYSVKGQQ